jgi:hypothetical protein
MVYENWNPVPGYAGVYEVPDKGNVRRILKSDRRKLLSP